MPRLFTGLEIPVSVAAQLASLQGGLDGARWIEPSDYHVTLRFFGDVGIPTARELAAGLDETRAAPLTVTLDALEAFGGKRPRSLIARVKPDRALSLVHGDHERVARDAGLEPEPRRFTPHVTLARLRDITAFEVADWLGGHALGPSITFTARRFVLYSARPGIGGGPYVVEAAYPLEEASMHTSAGAGR